MSRLPTPWLPLALAAALCGCRASLRRRAEVPENRPARIAVAPVKVSARIRKWSVLSSEAKPADEKAAIAAEISSAALAIRLDMTRRLADSGKFEVVAATDSPDAVLELDLSSYGRIKPRWLAYILGTSVIEGTVKGVLVAQIGGVWPAVGVATEEIVEETIEYGGGSYLFGRAYTPVTLEARLTRGGRTLWRKWEFAFSNKSALKTFPEPMRRDRDLRLALAAQRAADRIVKALAKRW